MAKSDNLTVLRPQDETEIYDSNDLLYPSNAFGKKIYAVVREECSNSIFFVNLLNEFGDMSGFDIIYERLDNKDTWKDMGHVSFLCILLRDISPFFHREFALEYIPKLQQVVWRNFDLISHLHMKNLTKEKLNDIINTFKVLLLSAYLRSKINEILENLRLRLCEICFESQQFETKLCGFELLCRIMEQFKCCELFFTTYDDINDLLLKKNVLAKICQSQGSEMFCVEGFSHFLTYIFNNDLVNMPNFQALVINILQCPAERKEALYEPFSSNFRKVKHREYISFILERLWEFSPDQITIHEIAFMGQLSGYYLGKHQILVLDKLMSFYSKVLFSEGSAFGIVEKSATELCKILEGDIPVDTKTTFLNKCVENISKGQFVMASLITFRRFLENCAEEKMVDDELKQETWISYLCDDLKLIEVVMKSLKDLIAIIQEREVDRDSLFVTDISERVGLIEYILIDTSIGSRKLNDELVEDLWDILAKKPLLVTEAQSFLKLLHAILASNGISTSSSGSEVVLRFCTKKLMEKDWPFCFYSEIRGWECMKTMFVIVNESLGNLSEIIIIPGTSERFYYRFEELTRATYSSSDVDDFKFIVNVNPSQLIGVQLLWNLVFLASDKAIIKDMANFLIRIYTRFEKDRRNTTKQYLDICTQTLKRNLDLESSLSIPRRLSLILKMLDKTHRYGALNCKSHSELVKRELLRLTIIKDNLKKPSKQFEIEMCANESISNLFTKISDSLKIPLKEICLKNNLSDSYKPSGTTLFDLGITNKSSFIVTRVDSPRAQLLDYDNALNPRAKRVFTKWFEAYSDNGLMDPEQYASFIRSCGYNHCRANDTRVKDFYRAYDDNKDGYLTCSEFLDFHKKAYRSKSSEVWSNLISLGEKYNLTESKKQKYKKSDASLSARYILSNNDECYRLFFSLLEFEDEIASKALELLNRLPTNKNILSDIILLRGIRAIKDPEQKDWNFILPINQKYRLLYNLHVIEYLIANTQLNEYEDESGDIINELNLDDPKLAEYANVWISDFLSYHGHDHLVSLLEKLNQNESSPILNNLKYRIESLIDLINKRLMLSQQSQL